MRLTIETQIIMSKENLSIAEILTIGSDPTAKYALSTAHPMYAKGAIMAGLEYKSKNKDTVFEVMYYGEALFGLLEDEDLIELTGLAKEAGVRILACENAIEKLEIDKTKLPSNVEFVSNSFIYFFGLQELGYRCMSV